MQGGRQEKNKNFYSTKCKNLQKAKVKEGIQNNTSQEELGNMSEAKQEEPTK